MRPRIPRTLRSRISVLLVVVLLVASAVIGVVTALSLRAFLVGRLDGQLADAGGRFALSLEHGRLAPGGSDGDEDNVAPGQSVGTLGVRLAGGRVAQAAIVARDGQNVTPALSASDTRALVALPVDGSARTVDFDTLGDYRLQAVAGRDGDTLITGLPQHEVDATVARLVTVESIVFGGVIALSVLVVALLVRRTMRPLQQVAEVARQVAALPLTEAATPLPSGLVRTDTDSEVGQVGAAFEHMIDHIRSALQARDATEERLRQFVADASHEFRTPLATIRAHSESLQRDGATVAPPVAATLRRIDAATDRMAALVDDLLLLARLDDGVDGRRDPVDLTRVVVEAVVDARALAPDHRWRLDLPEAAVEVRGDEDRLYRVVVNLLSNARLHTPAGTTVEVSVRPDDSASTVTILVVDDGPGVTPSSLPTLFDRFTRGDASRASGHGSTGLGLAIVHGVVTAHDGTIEVASVPGATTFTVCLPYDAGPGPDSAAAVEPVNLSKRSESP